MKASFLNHEKAFIVGMIQCPTEKQAIRKIEHSIADGADAIGVQLCKLKRTERTDEKLKRIFASCKGLPIYVTSYRYGESMGMTDDECAELLLQAASCGATLLDIPGDYFDQKEHQMTENALALEKQKALIEKIHTLGGEVLISTHDFRELTQEEIVHLAELQHAHGADIIKIVVKSQNPKVFHSYVDAMHQIGAKLGPYVFLDGGACSQKIRRLGGILGSAMYLCVAYHGKEDTPAQPTIKQIKTLLGKLGEE